MTRALGTVLLCLVLTACVAEAHALTVSDHLNNPGNPGLAGPDLGPPLFSDDFEIANNVALYTFSVSEEGTILFVSTGAAAGGIDPYFTLFQGTGSSATFLASNYTQAFSTGGDFSVSLSLTPGDYTVAIGAFANMSVAENNGAGTLGDGFVGLGQPDSLGSYYYEVRITLPGQGGVIPVPALNDWGMILLGVLISCVAAGMLRKRRNRVLY